MKNKILTVLEILIFLVICSVSYAANLPMREYVRRDYGFKVNVPESCMFKTPLPDSIANADGNGFTFQVSVNSLPGARGTHEDLRLAGEVVHDVLVNAGNRIITEKIINLNENHDGYLMIMTRPLVLQNGQTLHIATYYINVIDNGKGYSMSYSTRLIDAERFEETFISSFRSLYVM